MTVNARGESAIKSDILRDRRQYYVKEVKAPLLKSLVRCTQKGNKLFERVFLLWDVLMIVRSIYRYPEPTRDNVKKKMNHILFDIWDEFFEKDTNTHKTALFKAIRRILACEIEHDSHYSQRFTWFLKKLTDKYISGEWPPLEPWCPVDYWDDPVKEKELEKVTLEFKRYLTINGRPFHEVET